eukprot:COSAG01_NODE_5604_length_4152_cov_2.350851_8_plen_154_part_00
MRPSPLGQRGDLERGRRRGPEHHVTHLRIAAPAGSKLSVPPCIAHARTRVCVCQLGGAFLSVGRGETQCAPCAQQQHRCCLRRGSTWCAMGVGGETTGYRQTMWQTRGDLSHITWGGVRKAQRMEGGWQSPQLVSHRWCGYLLKIKHASSQKT